MLFISKRQRQIRIRNYGKKLSTEFGRRAGHQKHFRKIAAIECLHGQRDADRTPFTFGPDRSAGRKNQRFFSSNGRVDGTSGRIWQRGEMNHAFGSHVIGAFIIRDVLGLDRVDTVAKVVQVRFSNSSFRCARGGYQRRTDCVSEVEEARARLMYPGGCPAGTVSKSEIRERLPCPSPAASLTGRSNTATKIDGGYK